MIMNNRYSKLLRLCKISQETSGQPEINLNWTEADEERARVDSWESLHHGENYPGDEISSIAQELSQFADRLNKIIG